LPDKVFKLDLNLAFSSEAPDGAYVCNLCFDIIRGGHYLLTVENPLHTLWFDKPCFEQLFAAGIKLYDQIRSDGRMGDSSDIPIH